MMTAMMTDPVEVNGNFQAFSRMRIRTEDIDLSELIETSRSNAQYTCKTIQNALLCVVADLVQEVRMVLFVRFFV